MGSVLDCFFSKAEDDKPPLLIPLIDGDVQIVGFTGKAGSGKDTAADFLVEHFGFVKMSFAGPLKRGISEMFGIPMETMQDPLLKEMEDPVWGHSPRYLMQWLGTDVLRKHISDDFFIVSMGRAIKYSGHKKIVISDVRFDGEAQFIRKMGGAVYKISRPNFDSHISAENRNHSSEQGISARLVDREILNDSTLSSFLDVFSDPWFLHRHLTEPLH